LDKILEKAGKYLIKPLYLFIVTLIVIIISYFSLFGGNKTFELIKNEYLFIIGTFCLFVIMLYFKNKLQNYQLIDFTKNSNLSFKSTILIFLFCEIYDYYNEGGFLGMISQWFVYWIMGVFAFLLVENINYYKNYKLILKNREN